MGTTRTAPKSEESVFDIAYKVVSPEIENLRRKFKMQEGKLVYTVVPKGKSITGPKATSQRKKR